MESSKRAVEAYRRTRLIDYVITDDDKIAPVYRLEEICDTLRTSSADMVREMVEYAMRRLESRSPRVKQKVLRMIKYAVGKGGPEFKRQIQRQSAAIRQLFEYKGQPDPLRGDSLNKAVRETAHEAIAAIFASEEKPPQLEEVNKRIMGFGSTNYEMPMEGKKASITDVVTEVIGLGSASIKQGLSMISSYSGTTSGSMRTDLGTYRGPSLRRSLTSERETHSRFEREEQGDGRVFSDASTIGAEPSHFHHHETSNGRGGTENGRGFSREEKLVDTITAPGGMRLQPTRESLQAFLASALKLDPNNLGCVLDSKLHSHAWQVRFKALCVLEAILRQQDEEFFELVARSFEEDASAIQECLESPQTSLREKAKKVLNLLKPVGNGPICNESEASEHTKDIPQRPLVHDVPDLIDTSEPDLLGDTKISTDVSSNVGDTTFTAPNPAGDLLGDGLWTGAVETSPEATSDDLFAGVTFHTPVGGTEDSKDDLFSGLSVDRPSAEGGLNHFASNLNMEKPEPVVVGESLVSDSLADLMAGVSIKSSENGSSLNRAAQYGSNLSKPSFMETPKDGNTFPTQMLGSLPNSNMMYMNPSFMLPNVVGGFRAPIQNFTFGLPGNPLYQQQLFSGMAGSQAFSMGAGMMNGLNSQGTLFSGRGSSTPFMDGFDFSGDPTSHYATGAEFTKSEDTKAFDFISDHVLAARGPKKLS